jgi:hypothetical protein
MQALSRVEAMQVSAKVTTMISRAEEHELAAVVKGAL